MMPSRRSAIVTLVLVSSAVAPVLRAQACYGTPPRGGIAIDYGKVGFGTTAGVTGAYAGNRFAVGAGYRTMNRETGISGNAEHLRFALVLGGGSFQICPGLGFEFERDTWNARTGKVTSSHLTGWGGLGAGFEKQVYGDLSLIPFAGVRFAFKAIKYDLSNRSSEVKTTGDTVSRGEIQYGLLARYKIVYAGFIADHPLANAPPLLARFVAGLTFPIRD